MAATTDRSTSLTVSAVASRTIGHARLVIIVATTIDALALALAQQVSTVSILNSALVQVMNAVTENGQHLVTALNRARAHAHALVIPVVIVTAPIRAHVHTLHDVDTSIAVTLVIGATRTAVEGAIVAGAIAVEVVAVGEADEAVEAFTKKDPTLLIRLNMLSVQSRMIQSRSAAKSSFTFPRPTCTATRSCSSALKVLPINRSQSRPSRTSPV